MTEDPNVRLLAGNDGAIIDQLLKEKGLTRQQIAEIIQRERREDEEAEQKAREEKAKRDYEEGERLRSQHALEVLNSRMTMTIDGRSVSMPLEELKIKCPKCKAPSEFLRAMTMTFAERLERAKETSIGGAPGELMIILSGPIKMEGEIICRSCGIPLQVTIATAPPTPSKARSRVSREIDST